MKRFSILVLIGFLALSFTTNVSAQVRRDSRVRWTPENRAEYMAKELDLNADEKAKVTALFEQQDKERAEQVAENRAKRDELRNTRDARRKEMQDLRTQAVAENDAQLEQIIGKEKLEQWKEIRSKRQEVMRDTNRRGRRLR